jgi:hypothetical protein
MPLTKLVMKYSITDDGLKKVCKRMNIPIPATGYWEDLQSVKDFEIPELSSEYKGVEVVSLELRNERNIIQPSPAVQNYGSDNIDPNFHVPVKLTKPDKWIISARESLTAKKDHRWSDGLAHTENNELNIRVSPNNIPRALRFMDAFIKVMRNRGHDFSTEGEKVQAIILSEKVSLYLRESCRRITIKDKWERTELVPSGILTLTATFYFREECIWKDGRLPIDLQLKNIILKLEHKATETLEYRKECEKHRAEQQEKDRIRREFENRRSNELSEFIDLLRLSKRWKKTVDLRNYLDAYENHAKNENTLTEEKINWLKWARKKADWFDPEMETDDELLNGIDKDQIDKNKTNSPIFYSQY